MSIVSAGCYPMDALSHHSYGQIPSHSILPPPRSYYVVSWVPRALPEIVQLLKDIPGDAERCLINKHFELGMLVMRRCGVQNPEEIKCLLDGFREGTTRLSTKEHRSQPENGTKTDKSCCSPAVERRKLLIFFNDHRASRPWVLCPAKHCIKSARTTGKVKGRVKIFQFDPRSNTVKLPKLFFNCLSDFMTRDQYVIATFCPQQKYTDHELDWFDLRKCQDRAEPGGDLIFRDLVEEHDTKGTRMWPFEDYIIFANSQSKIIAVFKKKQPLLTLYRHITWPGMEEATTTASSMGLGSFVGSNIMAPATSCVLTTTSSLNPTTSHGTASGGAEFSRHGLEADDEACTVDVTSECQPEHVISIQPSQRRSRRGCRQSFAIACRNLGPEATTEETDADDDDSDFDISGKRSDRTGGKSGRRNRVRSDDFHSSTLPAPIASPAESNINMQDSLSAGPSSQMSLEYQFGFGNNLAPSLEVIRQAEEAENLLVHIMTRVLGQLEPLDTSPHVGLGSEAQPAPIKTDPSASDGSDRCITSMNEYDGEGHGATTTTDSAGLDCEDGQSSPFMSDGQLQRRKLDFAALGQDLEGKRRKVIHYPSPTAVLYHQLVRQFLSRLAFGLDHPPMPQKRIPDTVKRVVTKIVADSIKEINLALLTSSIRCHGDSSAVGEETAGSQGQMDTSYSPPFSFGSQAPPGNGAIVMSSRAGMYSTYDDPSRHDGSNAAYMQNYGVVERNLAICANMGMSSMFPGAMDHSALTALHFDPHTMDPSSAAALATMQGSANQFILGGLMGTEFSNASEQQRLLNQMANKEFQQRHMQYVNTPQITLGEVAVAEEGEAVLKRENSMDEGNGRDQTAETGTVSADHGEQTEAQAALSSCDYEQTQAVAQKEPTSPRRTRSASKRRKRSRAQTPAVPDLEQVVTRAGRRRKL